MWSFSFSKQKEFPKPPKQERFILHPIYTETTTFHYDYIGK